MEGNGLAELDAGVIECRACPRLVAWREEVARTKRAAFANETYWGRPVPGFGPADASLLVVGLAPAAHGGNRTGRMFTGDRSGDVLYRAMYDVGLASRPTAVSLDDGLELHGVRITSPVHCAPPANKPTPAERDTCRPWLVRELELLRPTVRAVVVLGAFGWQAALPAFREAGWVVPRPRPVFAHGAQVTLHPAEALRPGPGTPVPTGLAPVTTVPPRPVTLFGCFHVSQRNTFTGLLTPEMLRDVLRTAATAAGLPTTPRPA
ncbi:uracil-DNA glycosylase [Actinacidiphila acidipaludis]|uniref:Type-5 uracil-DNA glycosylase n=1 Tax=Actinacidiphila acidipaludis TaxID=2873382 RepID=A0ABS7QGJ4_9ACTN|nr:uracil-DNA glycosylase [Streptomyces acidipaludis]MBY8882296.1 uracil-DNA glycosylase [Streptomyces acidipaludis]